MEQIQKIKTLCAKYGIHPSKKLGQNFLIDAEVARKMCEAANLNAEDFVVEVGPGLGALTVELAVRAGKVVAVELDKKMFTAAKEILAPYKNAEIIHGDILNISNSVLTALHPKRADRTFCGGEYKVVASLPYSITSAVLRKFTEEEPRPSVAVVLVQKEVAQRVCAKPGQMSVLSVAVQYYGQPEIVAIVPSGAFWPVPEVESAILKIEVAKEPKVATITSATSATSATFDEKRLFQLVRIGFSSRRKQLQNNLMAGLRLPRQEVLKALKTIGLQSKVRAQELNVEQWVALSRLFTVKA